MRQRHVYVSTRTHVKRACTCVRRSRRDGIAEAVSRRPRCGCRRGWQPLRFSPAPFPSSVYRSDRAEASTTSTANASNTFSRQVLSRGEAVRVCRRRDMYTYEASRARARKRWRPVAPSRYAPRSYRDATVLRVSLEMLSRSVDRKIIE